MASGYPADPQTIGEYLRKRRLDLKLLQREVAVIIGVDKATIENWEYGNSTPNLRAWPGVIKFLGYDPRPLATTIGEKLRRHREGLGLSWAEAAKLMGVDPSTVTKWERRPDARQNHISIPKIIGFLGYNPMPEPVTRAARVRYVRLTLGLTQQQLADRLGVCQKKVWSWETDRQIYSHRVLEALMLI